MIHKLLQSLKNKIAKKEEVDDKSIKTDFIFLYIFIYKFKFNNTNIYFYLLLYTTYYKKLPNIILIYFL